MCCSRYSFKLPPRHRCPNGSAASEANAISQRQDFKAASTEKTYRGDALGIGTDMQHHRLAVKLPATKADRRDVAIFFHNTPTGSVKSDPHGANLPDVAAALSYAESKIAELRKESPYNDPALMMIVKDEAGKIVPFFPGR